MRLSRRDFIPTILIAVPGAAILGTGLTTARQDGTPSASPMASPAGSPVASPVAEQAAAEITVEMVDIAFNPTKVTIPADTDVTVNLPNNGLLPHNFNIDEVNVHSGDVPGGESTTLTLNLPAGSYKYYCNIPGHAESGMAGELTVE